jgi:acetyl esterase/lipase
MKAPGSSPVTFSKPRLGAPWKLNGVLVTTSDELLASRKADPLPAHGTSHTGHAQRQLGERQRASEAGEANLAGVRVANDRREEVRPVARVLSGSMVDGQGSLIPDLSALPVGTSSVRLCEGRRAWSVPGPAGSPLPEAAFSGGPLSGSENRASLYHETNDIYEMVLDLLRNLDDGRDPGSTRLNTSSHADLPPTSFVTKGFDPLRDVGRAYACKLAAARNDIAYVHNPNLTHGFPQFTRHSEACHEVTLQLADLIKYKLLAASPTMAGAV